MTYKEWFNSLSEDEKGKMRLNLKKHQGRSQDIKQLEKYKNVLGKDAPKSIEKFQNIKYDNKQEWEKLKQKYRSNVHNFKGLSSSDDTSNSLPEHQVPKLLEKLTNLDKATVLSKLKEYENIIVKDNEKENAIVITKGGEVWQCFGTSDRVFPDVDLGGKLYGASVTHNHPMSKTNYSFSDADLNLFLNYDLNVLRGCDYKFEYNLERTVDTIKEDSVSIKHKFTDDYFKNVLEKAFQGELEIGEYDEYHYINEVFSKYNKFTYNRREH